MDASQDFPCVHPDIPFSIIDLIKTMQNGSTVQIDEKSFFFIENSSNIFARSLKKVDASDLICFAVVCYTTDPETEQIRAHTVCRMELREYDPDDIEKCIVSLKGTEEAIEDCMGYFISSFPPDMIIKEPAA